MKFDIVVIGGGIGGAIFAAVMGAAGANVLVIEAKRLDIYEVMLRANAHPARYMRGGDAEPRDLLTTTIVQEVSLNFYHPAMQEALLRHAMNSGVTVWRGTRAMVTRQGPTAVVMIKASNPARGNGQVCEIGAPLVVVAQGWSTPTLAKTNFVWQQGAAHRRVAGILYDRLPAREDTVQTWRGPYTDAATANFTLLFPQGNQRVRAYISSAPEAGYQLSGKAFHAKLIELFVAAGAPNELFAHVKARGPLASHDGWHRWVDHPYHQEDGLDRRCRGGQRPHPGSRTIPCLARCTALARLFTANRPLE